MERSADSFNLVRSVWTKEDGVDFERYLETLTREDKIEWTRKIANTDKPLLAIPAPETERIAKSISKGDFLSFLDLNLTKYFEEVCINGWLIMKIKDFDLRFRYLEKYFDSVDSWATCDNLKFSTKKDLDKQWAKALVYVRDDRSFVRRIGVRIAFSYVENDEYLPAVYDLIASLVDEKEYYVNMCVAWLVCELFVKRRDDTFAFLQKDKLNAFTVNRAVQKCRDSFRVTKEDKDELLRFKK